MVIGEEIEVESRSGLVVTLCVPRWVRAARLWDGKGIHTEHRFGCRRRLWRRRVWSVRAVDTRWERRCSESGRSGMRTFEEGLAAQGSSAMRR